MPEEFENLSGQQKVQAAVKLLEMNHNLNGYDLLVVNERNQSGVGKVFLRQVDDKMKLVGRTASILQRSKWILFENSNIG